LGGNSNFSNIQDYIGNILQAYSQMASNYVESIVDTERMLNDIVFANTDAFKNVVDSTREHSKNIADKGKRNRLVYE
jgi:hypothetical protein